MDIKVEPSDQSIMKNYSEMSDKYGKLKQNYAKLQTQMAEVRKENSKLKEEMVTKNAIFERQIVTLNEELTKLKAQNQREDLEKQQGQNWTMDNSQQNNSIFDGLPIVKTEQNNEFTAETMMMNDHSDQQQHSQNLDNIIDSMGNVNANTIIKRKRKYENTEMRATSSTLNDEEVEEGNQNIGLELEVEFEEEEESVEMDLDEEEEDETSENEENGGIDGGQIECEPIKIGNIFKCNWPAGCEYKTGRPWSCDIRTHWRRVHTGERPFVCAECGKTFPQSSSLKNHALIHSGEKPHQCDEFGQSFTQSGQLKSHKRTHTELYCNWPGCEYQTKKLQDMRTHWRHVHTLEKPYVCAECGKSFARSKDLKRHERTHTGEKPHRCDVCGKSLSNSTSLIEHKRIHTGERPYVCAECGQSFGRSSCFKDHMLIHTGEKPHLIVAMFVANHSGSPFN